MTKRALGPVLLATALAGCASSPTYQELDRKYQATLALLEETRGQLKTMADVNFDLRNRLIQREKALEEIGLALRSASAVAADRELLAQDKARLLSQVDALATENQRISTELDDAFARLTRLRGIEYERGSGRLRLGSEILFESGKADLSSQGKEVLAEVGRALRESKPGRIRIEGHTDSDPVSRTSVQWKRGNWDLSGERALQVLSFLQAEARVPESMLSFAGYGPYRPVAGNDTADGKRRNRRVEIYVEGPALVQ